MTRSDCSQGILRYPLPFALPHRHALSHKHAHLHFGRAVISTARFGHSMHTLTPRTTDFLFVFFILLCIRLKWNCSLVFIIIIMNGARARDVIFSFFGVVDVA